MTYSTPITAVANATFTSAQYNASDRDNMLETPAAKATAPGFPTHFVGNGAAAIAERQLKESAVDTTETTASATYTDLATAGPSVTITSGTAVLLHMSVSMFHSVAGKYTISSWEVNADGTAADARSVSTVSGTASDPFRAGISHLVAVTAGSNTYKMRYRCENATGTFRWRRLIIMAW